MRSKSRTHPIEDQKNEREREEERWKRKEGGREEVRERGREQESKCYSLWCELLCTNSLFVGMILVLPCHNLPHL